MMYLIADNQWASQHGFTCYPSGPRLRVRVPMLGGTSYATYTFSSGCQYDYRHNQRLPVTNVIVQTPNDLQAFVIAQRDFFAWMKDKDTEKVVRGMGVLLTLNGGRVQLLEQNDGWRTYDLTDPFQAVEFYGWVMASLWN